VKIKLHIKVETQGAVAVGSSAVLGHGLMVSTKINIKATRLRIERTGSPSDKMTAGSPAKLDCQMSGIVAADKVVAWRRKSAQRQLQRQPNQCHNTKSKACHSTL
jgi:hypothetical protein